jgi:hypothetical protein
VHGSSSFALDAELDALAPDPEVESLTFHVQPFTRWQASFDERDVHDGGYPRHRSSEGSSYLPMSTEQPSWEQPSPLNEPHDCGEPRQVPSSKACWVFPTSDVEAPVVVGSLHSLVSQATRAMASEAAKATVTRIMKTSRHAL